MFGAVLLKQTFHVLRLYNSSNWDWLEVYGTGISENDNLTQRTFY